MTTSSGSSGQSGKPEHPSALRHWGRGALARASVALLLVGGLATGGWLVATRHQDPEPAPQALPQPAAEENTIGGGSGPSVLQASAPVRAQAAMKTGSGLTDWAGKLAGPLDVPARALAAYANGELVLRKEKPDCHLSWVTLAGLGKAGSNHGRIGGGSLTESGAVSSPLGPVPLQGAAGEDARDPRNGPMQLSTQQWQQGGTKVPGTSRPNVQDIDDAAIAAGRALCSGRTDLTGGDGWWNAVATFRDSDLFRQQVLGNAQLYAALSLNPAAAGAPSTKAVRFALDQLGLPYVWGGNGPEAGAAGFDCSGLTKASYDSAGLSLQRTADSQYRSVPPVPLAQEPKLGDLVFYGSPARIHHVGLYLGNGMMINAPTQGQAVQIHTYHRQGDDYAGAGRPAV